jgi:hypothetical protein
LKIINNIYRLFIWITKAGRPKREIWAAAGNSCKFIVHAQKLAARKSSTLNSMAWSRSDRHPRLQWHAPCGFTRQKSLVVSREGSKSPDFGGSATHFCILLLFLKYNLNT